jgi:hypothetical protein
MIKIGALDEIKYCRLNMAIGGGPMDSETDKGDDVGRRPAICT